MATQLYLECEACTHRWEVTEYSYLFGPPPVDPKDYDWLACMRCLITAVVPRSPHSGAGRGWRERSAGSDCGRGLFATTILSRIAAGLEDEGETALGEVDCPRCSFPLAAVEPNYAEWRVLCPSCGANRGRIAAVDTDSLVAGSAHPY